MTKKEDLEIAITFSSCTTFEMSSEYFPWFETNVVILCFDEKHSRSCHLFDGKLTIAKFIGDSNFDHFGGGYRYAVVTKYKGQLLTVGGEGSHKVNPSEPNGLKVSREKIKEARNQKTEILKRDGNKKFSWSVIEPDFEFIQGKSIARHSLTTVASTDITEEYVLLIGGFNEDGDVSKNVFKYNDTWFPFGHLKTARYYHNSIYWNGAVYVIGGSFISDSCVQNYGYDACEKTKVEIWNIKDSPDKFKTIENWPELFAWESPHLFIVQDSFFPDH